MTDKHLQRVVFEKDGGVAFLIPAPECPLTLEEIIAKDVPQGATATVVHMDDMPTDRTFRNAWTFSPGVGFGHDLAKAKEMAHGYRRAGRQKEIEPYDIPATIPSMAAGAEAQRAAIRAKYETMQSNIDAATSVEELKALIAGMPAHRLVKE